MAEVRLYPWPERFGRQFYILLKKNVILHFRNRRSLILRLAAPFFFMLLLWLVDKAIQADTSNQTQFKKIEDPKVDVISAIPACETDLFYRKGEKCYDFLYTPAGNPAVEAIVAAMRQGSNIPADKVLGFGSKDETDTWLAANTETTNGAVHFYVNGSDISFALQTNATVKYFKGDFQNVNTKFQLPLQLAAHKATTNYLLQQDGQTVALGDVGLSDFAHPAESTLSIVSAAGGPFIYAACMFGFIVQLSNVVMERETGLKQSLRTMGMMDSAYNASWAVWELAMALAASLVVIVSGYIFQFKMFLDNNFFVSFFLVFLFQVAMSALAFLFSPLVKKSFQAVYLGFTVFLLGWLMQIVVVFGIPYKPSYENNYLYVIFSLFPWTLFYKGVLDLGEMTGAANDQGISWSSRSSYCKKEKESDFASGCSSQDSICECVMPLGEIYTVLVGLYFFYMILALYLDQVIANGGVGNPPWFFLLPGYWFSSRVATPKQSKGGSTYEGISEIALKPMKVPGLDDFEVPPGTEQAASEQGKLTVRQERERMQAKLEVRDGGRQVVRKVHSGAEQAEAGTKDDLSVLEVYGLQKVFTGGSCASRKKDFWAVRGSWFGIEEGTIFCLLGPNGAGKTTTINCLTGMMKPTGGDAVICGAALTAPAALEHIRARMGVCPQFDVLWGELSGQEHLEVFAWVKGIGRHEVSSVVKSSLEQVNLTNSRNARTSTYSGGMRRRLSVALALLGNPKIVYLDEPTTGMDPISRRAVWDIIEASKKGRAIVLTTHSMEEADILGDRIGIMAKGSLRVVGTSIALKRIYGSGYQITINLNQRGQGQASAADQQNVEAVKAIFQAQLHMAPVEERPGFLTYLVPHERQKELASVLALLASQREQLGIRDPQVAMSSLEEVFLSIARQAEMEAATAAGAKTVPYTDAEGQVMEVPLGVDTIIHPHTNQVCKVIWGQDDVGSLQVFSVVPVENVPQPPVQN